VLPYREEKGTRPVRRGVAFVVLREDDAVLLRERPLKGLLGGMLEVPSSPWVENGSLKADGLEQAPLKAAWREMPGLVAHTFTHFHLELAVLRAEAPRDAKLTKAAIPETCRWVHLRDLHRAALPSVMRKVLAHALELKSRKGAVSPAARAGPAPLRAKRRSA
jgi:A/G-specific adenine glycosylase